MKYQNLISTVAEGKVARLGEKVPIGLLFAAFGSLKFGFGALLFGLLFESLASGDFGEYHFGRLKADFFWVLFSSYCCKISEFTVWTWVIQAPLGYDQCMQCIAPPRYVTLRQNTRNKSKKCPKFPNCDCVTSVPSQLHCLPDAVTAKQEMVIISGTATDSIKTSTANLAFSTSVSLKHVPPSEWNYDRQPEMAI